MATPSAVEPLSRLGAGTDARVVFVVPRDARRVVRLGLLGVAPGASVRVQQTSPTFVLRVGGTVLAFERCVADEVYVQRTEPAGTS